MSPVGPVIEIYASAGSRGSRRVEKTNISSRLADEQRRANRSAIVNPPVKPKPEASHFETHCCGGPLANGIPAGFIAQILGQVLATNKADAARRAQAYAQSECDPAEMRLIRWA